MNVFEELLPNIKKLISFDIQALILELKLLLKDLKYVFLGRKETFRRSSQLISMKIKKSATLNIMKVQGRFKMEYGGYQKYRPTYLCTSYHLKRRSQANKANAIKA